MKLESLFTKIVQKKVKADLIYQDDLVTAFYDLHPQAPVHILIVPNTLIPTMNDVMYQHQTILGRLLLVASKIAYQKNIHHSGYRLIINCNQDAGQEIYHLHIHLLGGKSLGPLLHNQE